MMMRETVEWGQAKFFRVRLSHLSPFHVSHTNPPTHTLTLPEQQQL